MKRILGLLLISAVCVKVFGLGFPDALDKNRTAYGVATNVFEFCGEMECFSYSGLPAGFACNNCVAVGPNAFATASHLGFTPSHIRYRGVSYTVVSEVLLAGAPGDAKLMIVSSTLPAWSATYTNADLAAHSSATFPNTTFEWIAVGNGASGAFDPGTPGETGIHSTGLNTKRFGVGLGLRLTNAVVCSGASDTTNFVKFQTYFSGSSTNSSAAMSGDSGTGVFLYNSLHGRYEFLGVYSCSDSIPQFNTWSSSGFPIYQHIADFGPYMGLDGSGTNQPAVVPSTKDRRSQAGGKRKR